MDANKPNPALLAMMKMFGIQPEVLLVEFKSKFEEFDNRARDYEARMMRIESLLLRLLGEDLNAQTLATGTEVHYLALNEAANG